jgi:enamine deaminase RidA (YjgF/YER057c/UK114 family)
MTGIELHRAPSLYPGAPYAYAASAPPGSRLIALAGACPLDERGATIGVGDYAGQASAALANLETALSAAGATIGDVLVTRVLVASSNREDLVAVWQVVAERFATHDVPSTLLGVTVLGYPDQLVEIEAFAAVPQGPEG